MSGSLDSESFHAGAQRGLVQTEPFGRVALSIDLPPAVFEGRYDVSPLHVLEGGGAWPAPLKRVQIER